MKIYRLYTENVNAVGASSLISRRFPEFTRYNAVGYWHGKRELSQVFEIITDGPAPEVYALARDIRALLEQEAVYVTEQDVRATLVTD